MEGQLRDGSPRPERAQEPRQSRTAESKASRRRDRGDEQISDRISDRRDELAAGAIAQKPDPSRDEPVRASGLGDADHGRETGIDRPADSDDGGFAVGETDAAGEAPSADGASTAAALAVPVAQAAGRDVRAQGNFDGVLGGAADAALAGVAFDSDAADGQSSGRTARGGADALDAFARFAAQGGAAGGPDGIDGTAVRSGPLSVDASAVAGLDGALDANAYPMPANAGPAGGSMEGAAQGTAAAGAPNGPSVAAGGVPHASARMETPAGMSAAGGVGALLDRLERSLGGTASETGSAEANARDQGASRAAQDAVAGRLSEVEGRIARERVERAMASAGVEIATEGDAVSRDEAAASTAAMRGSTAPGGGVAVSGQAALPAIAQTLPDSGADGASAALGMAGQGPASDLAASGDEVPAAARLAAKGANILASQRGGAITMRLDPPALGQLRIELRVAQGAVSADFMAATPEARVLLEANLGMLRERLESQGLSVERVTVHGGGRVSETVAAPAAQHGADARADGESRERSADRQGGRQDAAGGESRGRRDGDGRDGGRGGRSNGHWNESDARDFARVFGTSLQSNPGSGGGMRGAMTAEPSRRAG